MTLLELMLVLSLISVLTTLGVSGWSDYQEQRKLDNASVELMLFLNRIQTAASWRNEYYRIRLGWQGERWCLVAYRGEITLPCHSNIGLTFYQPSPSIELVLPALHSLTFYGRRNTTNGGQLYLTNTQGQINVIVSTRGRVRRCYERLPNESKKLAGLPTC